MASTGIIYTLIARDAASRTFDRVGRAAGRTDTVMGKLAKTAKIAGEAMAVGLAAGLAEGVKSASEFQAEMTRISTQAGGTAKDVKVLSDQVLKLGTSTQQGPQHLAESLYHLKSVGMDNVSAMKALKEASDLAAVGHANLEETTNALAGAWRTGIKGATSFHEAVSTVNAIIGAGNMSMDQFNAAIGTGILPSAKTFGLSMKQVGAALALMTDEGIDSASAATRLRMSFSLLGAPSGAAEKQLKKIHLTGLQLANAMRSKDGLIGAIQLLKEHLDASGLSAAEQSQLLSKAFGGGRSSSGILLMLNNLDVLKKKQDQINQSTGKFDDAVRMQRKTAEAQWHLLTSNLEVMGIRVGTKVLPYVTNFVKFLAADAMPAAARFGKAMGNLVPFGAIKKGFDDTKQLVTDFLGGLQGPKAPKALPVPMLKAPDVITPLKPAASDAANFGKTIHNAIAGGFKDIDWGNLGSILGKGLGDAIGWVGKHAADFTKKIAGIFGRLDFVSIGKGFGGAAIPLAIGFITNLFAPLFSLDFWQKHWLDTIIAVISVIPIGRIAGTLGKVFERIPFLKVFEPILKGIGKFGGWIEKGLGKVFGPIGRGIVGAFRDIFPGIAGVFEREAGLFRTRIGVWGLQLKELGSRAIRGLGAGAEAGTRFVFKTLFRFTKALLTPFARAGEWLVGKGRLLVSGLKDGIVAGARAIGRWISGHVISPVTGQFSRAGSWLVGKGSALVSGFKDGALSIGRTIGNWMWSHIGSPAVGAFKGAGKWLYKAGRDVLSGFWSGLTSIWKKLTGWVSGIAGWIKAHKGPISLDRRLLHPAGVALMTGLLSGLKFGFKEVGNFVYHVGDTVAGTVKGIAGSLGLGNSSVQGSAQQFAQLAMKRYGWGPSQWPALKALWQRESGWNYTATNPSSGAYGIPQALPASKMASAGADWRTNAATQIRWGLSYIKDRYGSPAAAWAHETKIGWYAKGTGGAAPGWAWVGERGPELVRFGGGETVLSHPQSVKAAEAAGIKLPGYASGTIMNAADRVSRDKKKVEDAKDALADAKRRKKGVAAAEKKLEAAKKELKAAEISLANAKRSAKTSIANTIATGLVKTLSTGTSSAIASAIKSLATKLLNVGYTGTAHGVMQKGAQLERLADRRDSIQKRIAEASQYAADQAGNVKDFLSISGTSALSVGGLIAQMTSQQKTASSFVGLTKSLKKQGASKELLAQLAEAGPGSQLAAILGQKNVSAADIKKLNQLTASGGKLADAYGKDMANLMYDSGKDAGKGFLSGLKSQEKALAKQMAKLATDLVKQIKKALKIKSPSLVFRDEVGKNVVLGMAHGIDMHSHLAGAAAQRLGDVAASAGRRAAIRAAVRARPTASLAFAGSAGTPQVTNVTKHVTINLNGARQSSAEQAMDVARHLAHVG